MSINKEKLYTADELTRIINTQWQDRINSDRSVKNVLAIVEKEEVKFNGNVDIRNINISVSEASGNTEIKFNPRQSAFHNKNREKAVVAIVNNVKEKTNADQKFRVDLHTGEQPKNNLEYDSLKITVVGMSKKQFADLDFSKELQKGKE